MEMVRVCWRSPVKWIVFINLLFIHTMLTHAHALALLNQGVCLHLHPFTPEGCPVFYCLATEQLSGATEV